MNHHLTIIYHDFITKAIHVTDHQPSFENRCRCAHRKTPPAWICGDGPAQHRAANP